MAFPIHFICGDNNPPPLRGNLSGRRRRLCVSAAWADTPNFPEKRRAIYSWSVGYGTLNDTIDDCISTSGAPRDPKIIKKGKVAEHALVVPARGRSLIGSIAVPHDSSNAVQSDQPTTTTNANAVDLSAMPGAHVKPILRRRNSGSTEVSTLIKRDNVNKDVLKSTVSLANLKKCETVVTLTNVFCSSSSNSSVEPLQATNRLRVSPSISNSRCSRCSSLLTLASASRYSLNSASGFIQIPGEPSSTSVCKLCLNEVPFKDTVAIKQCRCTFCNECMSAYVVYEIAEGAYDISCPDAQCPLQGVLQQEEIQRLAGNVLLEKHLKYRLNREVELDRTRTWCPRAGCETVCILCPKQKCLPQSVYCPTCATDFCSNCKLEWHEGFSCDEYNKKLAKEGKAEEPGIPFDSDLIKCCPMCNVPIEKDEGCAQMMCKRCKHVFCWYCLESLDDDFLLRHYDKGPCKNKLGHSRASVIWHRTQVIGIFAGFGILLLIASPLLLLAAPCIVCCKCRICNVGNAANTLQEQDDDDSRGEE